MSDYHFYDFYAIDRPLSAEQINIISGYSSRVRPSARRASFVYNYSDFLGGGEEMLSEFFDIMLFVTNWGIRRLLMKFPQSLVSFEALKEYEIDAADAYDQEIKVFQNGTNVLVDFFYVIEYGDWIEGEGMLDELLPLRDQILNGDYRVMYLAWLHLASEKHGISDDLLEPSLPANLKELDYSLDSFVNFWEIDEDLVTAASENSKQVLDIPDESLQSQIEQLSEEEKNQYLKDLVVNEGMTRIMLRRQLAAFCGEPNVEPILQARSMREIKETVAKQREIRKEEARKAAEKAYLQKMVKIEKEELDLWQEIRDNADLKKARGYARATEILVELKEYYAFKQRPDSFNNRVSNQLLVYGKSEAFKRRLVSNGII
ncbi:MAG: hypothetical protein AAF927_17120 [Bacteroidota bacterium]